MTAAEFMQPRGVNVWNYEVRKKLNFDRLRLGNFGLGQDDMLTGRAFKMLAFRFRRFGEHEL